ncbi:MAG TPA: YihY/virulence factor BrkB family protein [Microvirga sp.]|jgi:membrane protein|nr:YihY/virulence factor BrkB family protein [Microvirga sp.]
MSPATETPVHRLRLAFELMIIAYNRFVLHDAWAIASHIALSILMSLFPFLILMTAVASFFGTGSLADEAADIILEAWPREVAAPIASEIHTILTVRREGILTLGIVLALYFASSGVEALRVGLNRAYGLRETRAWWFTRLESIAFVMIGAVAMLAFAVLVVFGPLVWRGALHWLPGLQPFSGLIDFLRIGVATFVIVLALVMAHKLVPAGRRDFTAVLPGVGVTLALWIVGGLGFGWYLENYPGAYASTYGGLATAMAALVFLYTLAAIFLFGGELNGTVIAAKRRRLHKAAVEGRTFENVVKAPL